MGLVLIIMIKDSSITDFIYNNLIKIKNKHPQGIKLFLHGFYINYAIVFSLILVFLRDFCGSQNTSV